MMRMDLCNGSLMKEVVVVKGEERIKDSRLWTK